MKHLILLVGMLILMALVVGGYCLYNAQWNATHYVTERTVYDAPPLRNDAQLADDVVAEKNPAFDETLVNSRPIGDWQVNASAAVVRLDCPVVKPDAEADMLVLRRSYKEAIDAAKQLHSDLLPSANMLAGAAKQFDDGLYAALDLACFRGELGLATSAPTGLSPCSRNYRKRALPGPFWPQPWNWPAGKRNSAPVTERQRMTGWPSSSRTRPRASRSPFTTGRPSWNRCGGSNRTNWAAAAT